MIGALMWVEYSTYSDAWDQIKLGVDRPLPPLRDADTLNPEQRIFCDTLVNHYEVELGGFDLPQLLS
jgi:hypothetical protein